MKIRNGFVSNSSSSSFYITNKTGVALTLYDFVDENPQLVEEFKERFDWYQKDPEFCQENMLDDAKTAKEIFQPNETRCLIFGDEDGTIIGHVFDYILRDGGESDSFKWEFSESLR